MTTDMKLTVKIAMAATALLAMTVTSCKTNESNYRAAYEAAKQKNEESRGIEGTIYEKIRNEAVDSRLIVEGDTIPMMTVNVKIAAETTTPENVKEYSVTVNQFKQIFNAKSLMTRLRENGYPDAFLLETAEPLYYVIATTTDNAEDAKDSYRKIRNDKSVSLKAPFPWILSPARMPVK